MPSRIDANEQRISTMQTLQPPDWAPPRGYSNGIAARGTTVFVGGQIGWNGRRQFESDDFVAQAAQALRNVLAILAEAGGGPEHIARMNWYVTDKREYVASYRALGTAYREIMGRNFPAMTAVQVAALIEDRAKVEIEVTAMVPDV
jgi:enamine deaminase RidA (YjgF/YER057c/UK114 family)